MYGEILHSDWSVVSVVTANSIAAAYRYKNNKECSEYRPFQRGDLGKESPVSLKVTMNG